MAEKIRDTKEVTTPGDHKVVLHTYLTAREMMPLSDQPDMLTSQKTATILKYAIVSLDGSVENIPERLLDLPMPEYTNIVNLVTKIINPTTPEK